MAPLLVRFRDLPPTNYPHRSVWARATFLTFAQHPGPWLTVTSCCTRSLARSDPKYTSPTCASDRNKGHASLQLHYHTVCMYGFASDGLDSINKCVPLVIRSIDA
jgi:hypothetical protein